MAGQVQRPKTRLVPRRVFLFKPSTAAIDKLSLGAKPVEQSLMMRLQHSGYLFHRLQAATGAPRCTRRRGIFHPRSATCRWSSMANQSPQCLCTRSATYPRAGSGAASATPCCSGFRSSAACGRAAADLLSQRQPDAAARGARLAARSQFSVRRRGVRGHTGTRRQAAAPAGESGAPVA